MNTPFLVDEWFSLLLLAALFGFNLVWWMLRTRTSMHSHLTTTIAALAVVSVWLFCRAFVEGMALQFRAQADEFTIWVGPFITPVAIVSGVIAAIGTYWSLQQAALDRVADTFLNLRSNYHSDDMRKAIRRLVALATPVKNSNARQWNKRLAAGDYKANGILLCAKRDSLPPAERDAVSSSVRIVSSYFDDVAFLWVHRIIRRRDIIMGFLNVGGLNVFYEVCVPIYAYENAHSPSIRYARILRGIIPKYGRGLEQHDREPAPAEKTAAARLRPISLHAFRKVDT